MSQFFLIFVKSGQKNAQPKFSEIDDFEKFPIFYTYIICSNFLSCACICLIFVIYERGRAIFWYFSDIFWLSYTGHEKAIIWLKISALGF